MIVELKIVVIITHNDKNKRKRTNFNDNKPQKKSIRQAQLLIDKAHFWETNNRCLMIHRMELEARNASISE